MNMNDKTELLIRELAEKLGTTGEHLWGVLVQQAAISAVTDLLVLIGWAVILLFSFRFILRKTTTPAKTEDNMYPHPEWRDENAIAAWLIWGFATVAVIIIAGASLSTIIGAILNPEFWALKQIIK